MFTLFSPDGQMYAMTRDAALAQLLGDIMEVQYGQKIRVRYEPGPENNSPSLTVV